MASHQRNSSSRTPMVAPTMAMDQPVKAAHVDAGHTNWRTKKHRRARSSQYRVVRTMAAIATAK